MDRTVCRRSVEDSFSADRMARNYADYFGRVRAEFDRRRSRTFFGNLIADLWPFGQR